MVKDDALRFHNLDESAFILVILAVRPVHDIVP